MSNKWSRKPTEVTSSIYAIKRETRRSSGSLRIHDTAILWYKGWKEPRNCIRKQVPDHTELLTPTTLPDILYRKWVKGLTGKVIYEFTGTAKCSMTGKHGISYPPDISSIKNIACSPKAENSTKLVYLSFPLTGTLKVASELQNETVTPMASHPEVYPITGCWINKATGDWTIGFFEHFAVYQCQFWDYESIRTQKTRLPSP